jgi:opacity protein-like surface antigen
MAQNYFLSIDVLQMETSIAWHEIHKYKGEIKSDTSGTNSLDTNRTLNLKFGIDNIAHGRTYIKVGNLYKNKSTEYSSLSVNYDYYINKYNIFTPYMGIGMGYGKLTLIYIDKPKESDSDLDYTARIGTIIEFEDNPKAEIGYQYTQAEATIIYKENNVGNEYIDNYKAKTIKGFYISLNYSF